MAVQELFLSRTHLEVAPTDFLEEFGTRCEDDVMYLPLELFAFDGEISVF
jgi:hypothetical protein